MVVDNKIVGERMEFLRENMGVSQKNLAEYLDISQPYLSQIAAGKRPMSLTILDKLCALFGCSEQYLLGLDDSFHPKSYAFRSKKIDVADLKCIASINKLYKNLKYLHKKHCLRMLLLKMPVYLTIRIYNKCFGND